VWFGKRKGQAWRGSMVSSTLGVYPKAADAAKGEMLEIESGKGLKTDGNEAREFAAEISGWDGSIAYVTICKVGLIRPESRDSALKREPNLAEKKIGGCSLTNK
jgi:hypothetical protein